MKVSLITISFNSAATIEDTIRSVVAQDHPDIEYIIIDGASTDDTLAIIDRYQQHVDTLVSEKDQGIYDAMNKGVQRATGDVVGIINSDDVLAGPSVVSSVVRRFEGSGADAVYGDLVYVDRNDTNKVIRTWRAGEYEDGAFRRGWMPPHPTFYVKRSVYQELGGYDTRLSSAADYELMLRFIHKNRIRVAYLPELLVCMRMGGQSNVNLWNRWQANREDRLAWKLNGLKPGFWTMVRKPLSKLSQFFKRK